MTQMEQLKTDLYNAKIQQSSNRVDVRFGNKAAKPALKRANEEVKRIEQEIKVLENEAR